LLQRLGRPHRRHPAAKNYRSVIYMERLNEAVERIDSSFPHRPWPAASRTLGGNMKSTGGIFTKNLEGERENITLPGRR